MKFDPQRMCWVSLVPEEDAFEGMGDADDEDEEWGVGGGGGKGGTIRGMPGRKLVTVGNGSWDSLGSSGASAGSEGSGSGSGFGSGFGSIDPTGAGAGAGGGGGGWSSRLTSNASSAWGSVASVNTVLTEYTSTGLRGVGIGGSDITTPDDIRARIPDALWQECREADERHRREVKGWCVRPIRDREDERERARREEKRVWEIRVLAMRN